MNDSKIYTGYGDRGYTKTQTNLRISKADDLISLIGTLDEYSSSLGIAKASTSDKELTADIEAVQRKMVEIMSELSGGADSVGDECIAAVEHMTDKYLPGGFTGFTLSGVNLVSAQLDFSRTVVRRAERIAAKLATMGRVRPKTLVYLNRLSDLTYAFSRYAERDKSPKKDETVACVSQGEYTLSLALAKEMALAVEKQAEEKGKRVVTAILDGGANLMLLHAMDDAYIASRKIAQDKAYTAVALKMPTHVALSESRGGALDGLTATSANGLMLLGGGEPLLIKGRLVGGIGVSGGTAEEDTAFAEFGARYLERRLEL